MLKILRKKGVAKKVLWVVAIVVIISFGFLGTAYLITGQGQATNAGTIFGKDISFNKFQDTYRDVRIQAIIRYGDKFNDYAQYRNLDADTWDRLILLHEAKRRRIKVTNDDLIKTISQYEFFKRDGHFNNLLYQDVVRYIFKVPPRVFEEIIRDSLKINTLFAQETFAANVDEEEIYSAFEKKNEKVQISYIFISPEQYKNEVTFDKEKAQQYYEEHQFEFSVPQSINVDYIFLEYPKEDPDTEDQDEAILEEKRLKKELADTIYKEIQQGVDFYEAAKNNGIDAQSSGFFSMEQPNLNLGMSYELLKELFVLRKDQFSRPFETSNGVFIVKIADKIEAYIPDYEEAKDKVRDAVLFEAAKDITKQKAEELLPLLKAEYEKTLPNDFADAAKTLGLEIFQTPMFNRGQYLPKIGISKTFQEAAFLLNKEKRISDVVTIDHGYCILHIDGYIPADKEEYAQQKDEIAKILLLQKRTEIFSEFLSRLRVESNLIDNIAVLKQQQSQTQ